MILVQLNLRATLGDLMKERAWCNFRASDSRIPNIYHVGTVLSGHVVEFCGKRCIKTMCPSNVRHRNTLPSPHVVCRILPIVRADEGEPQRLPEVRREEQRPGGTGVNAHVGGVAQHLPNAHVPHGGQRSVQGHRRDSKCYRQGELLQQHLIPFVWSSTFLFRRIGFQILRSHRIAGRLLRSSIETR